MYGRRVLSVRAFAMFAGEVVGVGVRADCRAAADGGAGAGVGAVAREEGGALRQAVSAAVATSVTKNGRRWECIIASSPIGGAWSAK